MITYGGTGQLLLVISHSNSGVRAVLKNIWALLSKTNKQTTKKKKTEDEDEEEEEFKTSSLLQPV